MTPAAIGHFFSLGQDRLGRSFSRRNFGKNGRFLRNHGILTENFCLTYGAQMVK